jgi:hypothetical protein
MRMPALLLVAALAACTTETKERDIMGRWKGAGPSMAESSHQQQRRREEAPEPPPAREVDPTKEVTVPEEVVAKMGDFMNRRSTIFADAVEVDLSRNGFLANATFAVAADAVERRDVDDRGVLTITLTRRPDIPATKETVPTVRFGFGLQIVGVDRVTLRFGRMVALDRPLWFHAVGAGKKAFYSVETEPRQEWRGTGVDVRADVLRGPSGYAFSSSAEAKP